MIKRKLVISFFLFAFASLQVISQVSAPSPLYKLVAGKSFVQSKNYYLLTLMEQNSEVRKLLETDPVLSPLALNKLNALSVSVKSCNNQAFCLIDQMKFSDHEIHDISERLAALYNEGNALGKLVHNHLMPSGNYMLFNNENPKEFLVKAWEQDAQGINYTIGVYGEGDKPNYPGIDSTSLKVSAGSYGGFITNVGNLLVNECRGSKLFFSLPLSAALQFLELDGRDNAADYEPMASTINKAAYESISKIKWNDFKYSVILIPGAGPEDRDEELSAESMIRCRLGALQYFKGLAPLIMVSGGRVHPYKTKYCEAFEMKKFLVEKLQVPENAILTEPHARHTTTNMRNCVRIMFRYGIPFNKPGIACTTPAQSLMIGVVLPARCLKELKEVPYRNGSRLSETEGEFYPLIEALQINPNEPMDP